MVFEQEEKKGENNPSNKDIKIPELFDSVILVMKKLSLHINLEQNEKIDITSFK